MKELYPYFSQNPLDRLDSVRYDKSKFLELINCSKSLFLLFDGFDILVDEKKKRYLFSNDIIKELDFKNEEIILLGSFEDIAYFTINAKNKDIKSLTKISLREFASYDYVREDKLGILAQACSVLNWHNSHLFCTNCGNKTIMSKIGWKRDCLSCKKEHFPRIDSVVIMLVTYGDYCLIGRGAHFEKGRYSCLAGYVESGETLEAAAKRELFEEAGIKSYDVQYLLSQPWPFPSTLMIGIRMKAKTKELNIDTREIEHARWVHKKDMKEVLNGSLNHDFTLPNKIAIARNLLEIWVSE